MAGLVDLEMAKRHLRLSGSSEHDDLSLKLVQAEAVILDYLARPADLAWAATMAGWTDETVPETVRAAILLQLGELYRWRGDDEGAPRVPGFLSEGIRALLMRARNPVIA